MMCEEAIERALQSQEPLLALRSLAQEFVAERHSTTDVIKLFEEARERVRAAGREADEDLLLDVMDFLTGWCSPHLNLQLPAGESQPGESASAGGPERDLAPVRPKDT